jgi:hypothetical protein
MKFTHKGHQFKLISDIHYGHYKDGGVKTAANIGKVGDPETTLILAGDIFDGLPDIGYCRDMLTLTRGKYRDAIWILGNHDMLDQTPEGAIERARTIADGLNFVEFLEMDTLSAGDLRIHGATGWFPYDTMNQLYERQMLDFNYIRGFGKWVYDHHAKTRDWLKESVRPGDLVITHHLPVYQAVDKFWMGNVLNRFFVASFEDVLATNLPEIWCHGHSHSKLDTVINETRVLRNPKGYPGGG